MITATAILATSMLMIPTAAAETENRTDSSATDVAEVERDRVPLKLRCRGMVGLGWAPKVRCTWNETNHPDAAGYKLVRVGEGERTVVHQTRDLSATRFKDRDVEFNTWYRYRVIVVDEEGQRIQRSRWNRAVVRRPNVEVLRLKCAAVDAAETDAAEIDVSQEAEFVGCRWRPANSAKADHYELWRLIRGQHRELVAEVGLDQLSQMDKLPGDTEHVVYALLARDSEDHIVGRSRLSKINFVNDAA
ncbi:MAG: hypothetical protein ACR2PK_01770 [Acidimicrobiales bacterium]